MDIHQLCGAVKDQVTLALQGVSDPEERGEILIDRLYELSRSVLPMLGPVGKSQAYLAAQGEVLELISFLAILMLRNPALQNRGVAVMTEIGEECLDPLLRRKLSVYAQELLAKSTHPVETKPSLRKRLAPWCIGLGSTVVLALFLVWFFVLPSGREGKSAVTAANAAGPDPAVRPPPAPFPAAAPLPSAMVAGPGARVTRGDGDAKRPVQIALEGKGGGASGEQVTNVKIINNQVLVPVILKNGGETVKAELLLDTGSTRTAIHDELAGRLKLDLRQAKVTMSEVADGRMVRSRLAAIDSVGIGPYAMTAVEVEFISYKGNEGIHDGLLGMDFLGKHRYQIDMEHELIRWY